MNDIVHVLNVPCLIYADDVKIFYSISSIEDALTLQQNITRIQEWCVVNKLPLNPLKCNVMSYTLKSDTIKFDYGLNNIILQRPDVINDLGVSFDSKLTFSQHIINLTNSALKSYGFIARNSRDFLDCNTLKILYYAYVRSKLEYASLAWSPHYATYIDRIESVQRRFLKLLSFKIDGIYPAIGTPHSELLNRHSIQSLRQRRDTYSLIFIHKALKNEVDIQTFVENLNFYVPRSASRGNQTFYLPTPRTNALKFSPFYTITTLCNSATNIDIFNCSIGDIKSYYSRHTL